MREALWAGLVAGYGIAVPVGAIAPLLVGLSARLGLRVGAAAALGVASADGLYALLAVVGGVALAEAIEPVSRPLRLLAAAVLAVIAVRTIVVAVRRHRQGTAVSPEERDAEPAGAVGPGGADAKAFDEPNGPGCAPIRPGGADGQLVESNGEAVGPEGQPGGERGGDAGRRRRRGRAAGARGETLRSPGRAYVGLLGLTLLNPATVVYFAALVLGERAPSGGGSAGVFVVAAFAASASWQLALAGGGAALGRVLTGPRGRLGTALVSSAVVGALALTVLLGA